nr:MAG TPA: hypothetical protein [Caudoviricetes sp.]
MKLIDLLVKELPKRGGWPEGAEIAVQDADSQICFSSHSDVYANKGKTDWYGGDWCDGDWSNPFIDTIADDRHECVVTRDQYESALAASQKPAWDGEGLPPVGCECEISFSGKSLGQCEILFVGDSLIVWKQKSSQQEGSGYHRHMNIRPLHTEAERKRDAAIEAMQREADDGNNWVYSEYEIIYDAIAEGKIPGVKLDD